MFPDLVVLGKLKEDLKFLSARIADQQPDLVLGVALSPDDVSYFEMFAANDFHGKQISQSGPELLSLFVPASPSFVHRSVPTNSFCNYAAYWLSSITKKQKPSVPITLTHVTEQGLNDLSVFQS